MRKENKEMGLTALLRAAEDKQSLAGSIGGIWVPQGTADIFFDIFYSFPQNPQISINIL